MGAQGHTRLRALAVEVGGGYSEVNQYSGGQIGYECTVDLWEA